MRSVMLRAALVVLIAAGAVSAAQAAGASATTTRYSVRFLGLPIARASFTTKLDGKSYAISGTMRSAGLARIFDSTHGSAEVTGIVRRERLQARSYVLSYQSGKKSARTAVSFRNGNVASTSQTPKEKPHGADWVALGKGDLRAVLDPISGLIAPAGTSPCPRTVPVFDGETRVDIVLEPDGRQPFSTAGYRGEALACKVHFVPKAGFRRSNSAIRYLKQADSIEVWFAPSPSSNMLAPVYARVPTRIGSVTLWATQFAQ